MRENSSENRMPSFLIRVAVIAVTSLAFRGVSARAQTPRNSFISLMPSAGHSERLQREYDSRDRFRAGHATTAEAGHSSLFSSTDPAPKIAFTFDDLPVHGPLPPGESRMDVISKIIAALHQEDLPPTYGFVNAVHLEGQPEHAAVLDA